MDSDTFDAVVEIPKGSRNKYEIDHETGVLRLDRQLFTATRYPTEYGFIRETLGEDGDPLDVLVVLDEPTFPGCHIECRAVGMLSMHDEKGPDTKILAVAFEDPRLVWQDIGDVPDHLLIEISHFFEVYKDLEPGAGTDVGEWKPRAEAEAVIRGARERYGGGH